MTLPIEVEFNEMMGEFCKRHRLSYDKINKLMETYINEIKKLPITYDWILNKVQSYKDGMKRMEDCINSQN